MLDESSGHKDKGVRVSFRGDVVFEAHHAAAAADAAASTSGGTEPTSNNNPKMEESSLRSRNSIDSATTTTTSSTARSSPTTTGNYSKLRSNLTRENKTNRDPFFFYEVTKALGAGSMGDVKLVKKRHDKVGGSARRNIQQAVRRQQREQECLEIPVIGGLFQTCLDGDLKDEKDVSMIPSSSSSISHHTSFKTLFGGGGNNTHSPTASSAPNSRSFGDSSNSQRSTTATSNSCSLSLSQSSSSSSSSSAQVGDIIYAMKSIHLEQFTQQIFIDELRNEIAILKNLDHPNIVRAIETFEFKGKISIVMELCCGGDLYARDPYSEAEAARIVNSILSAIAYMHSRNIVHRDIKFENVLFVNTSPMSDIKLIDFGLSKVYVDRRFTDICGTIYTMAPEVILGQHTEKADMWSIGVVTFMLLSSALPFYGKERMAVAQKIIKNDYHFRGSRWKKVSKQGRHFIRELLVLDQDKRLDAETALGSAWFHQNSTSDTTEEEAMAKSSLFRYAGYPKLKKIALMVVAHKSSNDEIGILRKIFQKYSSKNDGCIWFEEFNDAMRGSGDHLSEEDLRAVFHSVDLDGSGKIRYTEFIAATIEAHGAISEARLAEAFDLLDVDDSGYITAESLIEILGHDFPRDEINAIIEEADASNDNRISYSDYLALWENQEDLLVIGEKENALPLGSMIHQTMRVLSSMSLDSGGSDKVEPETETSEAHAEFLLEKHLQNTLHTWNVEMQLPAKEFAIGCSFLHQVALGNQTDLDKLLEERPKLINFRDYDRRTALHIAASEGHVGISRYLVEKGARVNRKDRWNGMPLDDAHRHHHTDVFNFLRQHGAKFGSTSQTVNLITAASQGDVEEVRTLLEFGSIDLNQGDYDHRTALHLAASEGHLEVVRLLCEAGADVNVKDRFGDRPEADAKLAKKNSKEILNLLAEFAATVSSRDEQRAAIMRDLKDPSSAQSKTSLKPSNDESNDREETMTQLSAQDFAMGCSVLHQTAIGNLIVLKIMLHEHPELVNFRDYDRRTALHIAASEGHVGICRFLVENGAKINRVDRYGGSALDDAHRERHGDVVKFLREKGARFGSTSQITNFITAASEGDKEEVRAFLEFGSVDMNKGDYDRRTALHLAAGEGRLEIVELLCDAGADVNVVDRWGRRPLDDAARNAKANSTEMMKLLVKRGAKSTEISTMLTTAMLFLFGSGSKRTLWQ